MTYESGEVNEKVNNDQVHVKNAADNVEVDWDEELKLHAEEIEREEDEKVEDDKTTRYC